MLEFKLGCYRDPLDRPSRLTKPRHRRINIRAHQAVYQRKTVARGGKVGPVEPPLKAVQVHFGGKFDLILLKAVMNVFMYKLGGNQPQGAIKGASLLTLNTHHLEASLSTLSCDLYSLG